MQLADLEKKISANRKYKLAEAANLVSPVMSAYLFYCFVRVRRRAETKDTVGGLCRDLTGAEVLEIVRQANSKPQEACREVVGQESGNTPKPPAKPDLPPLDVNRRRNQHGVPPQASDRPPGKPAASPDDGDSVVVKGAPWAWRIFDRPHAPRGCSPATLEYLGRAGKVFAQLPDRTWYIRRHSEVAAHVRPSDGLSYIWHLLWRGRPVETSELIGADTSFSVDDEELEPYNAFSGGGWRVTQLFDEEKEYDKVCKRFARAISAIEKINPELGRYFQLAIQRPSENTEGWLLHDPEPSEWILEAEAPGTDAAMHKLGDSWLLRWGDTECSVPNDRIGIEYVARILQWPHTGVPCCLLRDPNMADTLAAYPDVRSVVPILKKYVRRQDCQVTSKHDTYSAQAVIARLISAVERKAAEATLDGRMGDAAEITNACETLKAAVECRKTRERLIPQMDNLNAQGRTQIKKNLDSAIEFLRGRGAQLVAEHLVEHLETGEVCFYSGSLNWEIQGLRPFPDVGCLAVERLFGVRHLFF